MLTSDGYLRKSQQAEICHFDSEMHASETFRKSEKLSKIPEVFRRSEKLPEQCKMALSVMSKKRSDCNFSSILICYRKFFPV